MAEPGSSEFALPVAWLPNPGTVYNPMTWDRTNRAYPPYKVGSEIQVESRRPSACHVIQSTNANLTLAYLRLS